MNTRECDCPHEFPFCVCALGYTGDSLAYHSRVANSVIGWPTLAYDPAAVAEHNARMQQAREKWAEIEAANAAASQLDESSTSDESQRLASETVTATLSPADKPRVALGVDQSTLPPPDCIPCQQQAASAEP